MRSANASASRPSRARRANKKTPMAQPRVSVMTRSNSGSETSRPAKTSRISAGSNARSAGAEGHHLMRRDGAARAEGDLHARRDDEPAVRARVLDRAAQTGDRVRQIGDPLHVVDEDALRRPARAPPPATRLALPPTSRRRSPTTATSPYVAASCRANVVFPQPGREISRTTRASAFRQRSSRRRLGRSVTMRCCNGSPPGKTLGDCTVTAW